MRELYGGLSPRPGLMGCWWEFPSIGPSPSSTVVSLASLSSPPSASSSTTSGSPAVLGHDGDGNGPVLATLSTLTAAEHAAATYGLSEKHVEMTERWPAGLLAASKALIADVPG